MKKALSILLCYALGMVACAYDARAAAEGVSAEAIRPPSIDFENESLWGKCPQYPLDDEGKSEHLNPSYWRYEGDGQNGSEIRKYGTDEKPYDFDSAAHRASPRPSYMNASVTNDGLLVVSADGTLSRTFVAARADGQRQADCLTVPESGLYLDTLVEFSISESLPDPQTILAEGDKLQCCLRCDSETDPTWSNPSFIITAGAVDENGELTAVNYFVTNRVAAGTWYRLTARMYANASTKAGETWPALALYLDGNPIACDPAAYPVGAGAAERFAGNEHFEQNALFPVMQKVGGAHYADRLYSFAVSGASKIDEFALTEANPFPTAAETLDLMIVCDDVHLAALTNEVINAAGTQTNVTVLTSGFNGSIVTVHPGDTVTITPVAKGTFSFGEALELAGNVSTNTIASASGYTIHFAEGVKGEGSTRVFADASRVTATISSKNVYFRVGNTDYTTFTEAMVAAKSTEGHRVTLIAPVTLSTDPRSDNGQARVKPGQTAILDLHGHSITGEHFVAEAAIYNQGNLTIVDYSENGGGEIVAPGTAIDVVRNNDAIELQHKVAHLWLGDENTKPFTIKGRVTNTNSYGVISIKAGNYLSPTNLIDGTAVANDDFYLRQYLADERFDAFARDEVEGGIPVRYWCVTNDSNAHVVSFEVAHGEVAPAYCHIPDGQAVGAAPVVTSVGYTGDVWRVKGTEMVWNLASDPVTENVTLELAQGAEAYSIAYDEEVPAGARTSYTVESSKYTLPYPTRWDTRRHIKYDGWIDQGTGEHVVSVGAEQTFVESGNIVTGNLQLVAQWLPDTLTWSNAGDGLAESNGTYSGSWAFRLPSQVGTYEAGDKIAIDEIAFALVNPTTYPKTAPRLAVTNAEGVVLAVSQERTIPLNPTSGEYSFGGSRLANGRARVAYKFDNLTVTVGESYRVFFVSDEAGAIPFEGFLRLGRSAQGVFGPCEYPPAPSEDYTSYVPIYEITGHMLEEAGDE